MKIVKPGDLIPLLLTVLIIILIGARVYTSSGGDPLLHVQSGDDEYLYPLDEDREIGVEGTIGISYILIEGGEVSFTDSPCPDKLCVHAASLSKEGDWNACLPNRIFVRIYGEMEEGGVDDLSY